MSVYGKSQMGKFMLIGGLVGCGLSLMSRETRSVWGHHLSTAATGGSNLIRAIYQHPDQVGKYMQVTGTRLKGLAREVSDDFQQMIDRVEKARTSTSDTYQYVMEVGNELAEMAGKIKQSGKNIANYQEPVLIDNEADALQRLENETSVPNPGTMLKDQNNSFHQNGQKSKAGMNTRPKRHS
ncbi:hypothetical protein NIE88_08490 [Sporolactobacillus shoreicorticis]|uniref:Uncharacterized protein n=1 Tax=Sporolactobacillus shoreicorticis TaxID=1923877 RepID=A0ABW5S4C9_9BACL|nr:hypothetical protein [Sporolactobacillus shoreicorticis]MCO7125808.1 hypothetical protein [Sporolactobacillus shoreicorticis]